MSSKRYIPNTRNSSRSCGVLTTTRCAMQEHCCCMHNNRHVTYQGWTVHICRMWLIFLGFFTLSVLVDHSRQLCKLQTVSWHLRHRQHVSCVLLTVCKCTAATTTITLARSTACSPHPWPRQGGEYTRVRSLKCQFTIYNIPWEMRHRHPTTVWQEPYTYTHSRQRHTPQLPRQELAPNLLLQESHTNHTNHTSVLTYVSLTLPYQVVGLHNCHCTAVQLHLGMPTGAAIW
jgi:hypothetical protein